MTGSIVIAPEKRAFYFGCWDRAGRYLHDINGRTVWESDFPAGFPWNIGHLDTGLLKNGKHEDVPDGRVWWTCGGTPLWLAFFWWDRSVDRRGACNSGFYVQGFNYTEPQAALDYAGTVFPAVISRQRHALKLQP